jgi:hypothetical protein
MNTEFLLYLVSIALIVFIIIHYFTKDEETKIIPIYKKNDDNNNQPNHHNQHSQYNNMNNNVSQTSSYSGLHGPGVSGVPGNLAGPGVTGLPGSPGGPGIGGPGIGGPGIGGPGIGGPVVPAVPGGAINPYAKLLEHDVRQIDDPLTPPYSRSYYEDEYAYLYPPGLGPYYNRFEGKFRKIGLLIGQGLSSNDKFKFLNLIGRQKYRNRDYEYYVISTDKENNIKIEIDTRGKEIRDSDIVKIPELDNQEYMYKEDDDISPKYNPFIY